MRLEIYARWGCLEPCMDFPCASDLDTVLCDVGSWIPGLVSYGANVKSSIDRHILVTSSYDQCRAKTYTEPTVYAIRKGYLYRSKACHVTLHSMLEANATRESIRAAGIQAYH